MEKFSLESEFDWGSESMDTATKERECMSHLRKQARTRMGTALGTGQPSKMAGLESLYRAAVM